MSLLKYIPLVCKQVARHRVRTLLTASGIAVAMFLFTSVQAMQRGVESVTAAEAGDTELVVYRKDRFCPATSRLPEDYGAWIARLPGVASVLPTRVVVSNCRTSLDVVTFRGVPKEAFLAAHGDDLEVLNGSLDDWLSRTDAALVGETLSRRRGLVPGMRFDAAGITAYVAAVVRSAEAGDNNAAYTALPFVQLAGRDELGVVTQFNVRVDDPARLESVAESIDARFATDREPTATWTEKAFVGRVADDIVELVGFARWLGLGCLAAVLALVANAIVLAVQGRVAEHAVLQTLGFTGAGIAALIVAEGVAVSVLGGLVGAGAAAAVARLGGFALSVEGQSIPIAVGAPLLLAGLGVCIALAVLAGLAPAAQAARRPIPASLRAV